MKNSFQALLLMKEYPVVHVAWLNANVAILAGPRAVGTERGRWSNW